MSQGTKHNIRENLFQKQHAQAMQALIWAVTRLKKNELLEEEQLKEIEATHQAAFKAESGLKDVLADIKSYNKAVEKDQADLTKSIATLKKLEKEYHEDLERKASRHKLSIFFTFFMALGCGTTIAGSNFLMGAEQGWLANIGILSSFVIISIPIIVSVTMANWWLGVRDVFEVENKNEDPYELVKKFIEKYLNNQKWLHGLVYTIGIFLIELYNAIGLNFKKDKKDEKEKSSLLTRVGKAAVYFSVILGALIYAFFAFAATYDLGMGIYNLMLEEGVASASGVGIAETVSAFGGILMAVPTYITMKVFYYLSAKSMMTPGDSALDIIDKIPGANKKNSWGLSLKHGFIFGAFLIVASVGFMTYAATAPLDAWFQLAGMAANPSYYLSICTIAVAFVGNIPFFVQSAAKSFKQMYDPRVQLRDSTNKWFPYIRFWNAVLNALPVVVGILAFFGLLALPGPWTLLLPIALNLIMTPAGGIASYLANCNGSASMYQFDPAKQWSKFQLKQLDILENGQKPIEVPYGEMSADHQLQVEYLGAKEYLDKEEMPDLAIALGRAVCQKQLDAGHEEVIYRAFDSRNVFGYNAFSSRLASFFWHDNVRYVQNIFSYDYLNRIEDYASDAVKAKVYYAALHGAGAGGYLDLLKGQTTRLTIDLTSGLHAELFWKAYASMPNTQMSIVDAIDPSVRNQPEIQELLMKHSQPAVRKRVVATVLDSDVGEDKAANGKIKSYLSKTWTKAEDGHFAYNHFHYENILELNSITGFWMKNLAFPLVLTWSVVKSLARKLPVVGRLFVDSVDMYQYFTELADEDTRVKYLSDVLTGYIQTQPEDMSAAKILKAIIDGSSSDVFSYDETAALRSGIVGKVFSLAGKIPAIKERLLKVLDESEAQSAKADKVDALTLKTVESPKPKVTGNSSVLGYMWEAVRSTYTHSELNHKERNSESMPKLAN